MKIQERAGNRLALLPITIEMFLLRQEKKNVITRPRYNAPRASSAASIDLTPHRELKNLNHFAIENCMYAKENQRNVLHEDFNSLKSERPSGNFVRKQGATFCRSRARSVAKQQLHLSSPARPSRASESCAVVFKKFHGSLDFLFLFYQEKRKENIFSMKIQEQVENRLTLFPITIEMFLLHQERRT